MAQPGPDERITADLNVTGARVEETKVRAEFGKVLINAFVAGLAFLGLLIVLQTVITAVVGTAFLSPDDLVKVATTFGSIIGPPLGFVISYYFKEREGS